MIHLVQLPNSRPENKFNRYYDVQYILTNDIPFIVQCLDNFILCKPIFFFPGFFFYFLNTKCWFSCFYYSWEMGEGEGMLPYIYIFLLAYYIFSYILLLLTCRLGFSSWLTIFFYNCLGSCSLRSGIWLIGLAARPFAFHIVILGCHLNLNYSMAFYSSFNLYYLFIMAGKSVCKWSRIMLLVTVMELIKRHQVDARITGFIDAFGDRLNRLDWTAGFIDWSISARW